VAWCAKDNFCDFSHQINPISTKPIPPKHRVPCPFLQGKGRCKKGRSCDFFHILIPRHTYSQPTLHQTVPPAFFGGFKSAPSNLKPFPLRMLRPTYPFQPITQAPFYPYVHPPIPTYPP
jgi:hypothetical protein